MRYSAFVAVGLVVFVLGCGGATPPTPPPEVNSDTPDLDIGFSGPDGGPTDPGPTDPGPTDPGPTDPGPTDPGPTDPGPTDPGPSEPTPEPAKADPKPAQGDPPSLDPPANDPPKDGEPKPGDGAAATGVSGLIAALADQQQRDRAASALAAQGAKALPQLTAALKSKDWQVRAGAVYALGLMGNQAQPAVGQLEQLAQGDGQEAVQDAARFALDAIAGK